MVFHEEGYFQVNPQFHPFETVPIAGHAGFFFFFITSAFLAHIIQTDPQNGL